MKSSSRIRPFALGLAATAALSWATVPVGAATAVEPMPTVTLLPVTAQSYPWLYYKYTQRPLDLDKAGFVEEEYLVSGNANVYDWDADPSKDLIVKIKDAPYTGRILVRRPKDPAKFSGTVVVETMNPARGYDMSMIFGWISQRILDRGDMWIGVSMPGVTDSLHRFDARYSKVSFANPLPEAQRACAAPAGGAAAAGRGGRGGRGGAGANATEAGLRLDMLAQVASWVKSNDASNPVRGRVKYAFLTGHTGGDVASYVASVARQTRLANGKPIYDGFIAHSGSNAGALMNCGRTLAANDPRQTPGQGTGVPFVVLKTQTDLPFEAPRPDSDAPNDILRVYDLPAAAHADDFMFAYQPLAAQQSKASDRSPVTAEWPFDGPCDVSYIRMNPYPQGYLIDGVLENLERYARDKTPLPKAPRVSMTGSGDSAKPQLDQYGNAVGGLRLPYIDVPTGTYHEVLSGGGGGGGAACGSMGYLETWPWQKTMGIYGTYNNYVQKVNASIQKAVADRLLTPADAERVRKDMLAN